MPAPEPKMDSQQETMEAVTGDEERDENSLEQPEGEAGEGEEKNEVEEITFVGDDESQFFN